MEKYNAIIFAGGRSPWLKEIAGTDVRCLARLNGKRILDYIVEALRESGRIKRIILSISPEAMANEEMPAGVELCPAEPTLAENVHKGLRMLGFKGNTLYVSDDIPFLHGAVVNDFLDKCEADPGGDFYFPLVPKEVSEATFPGAKRTYGKILEGAFTGGNIILMNPEVVPATTERGKEVFAKRKSPLALAKMLGASFILKFIFRRLSLKDIEKRGSEVIGFDGRAVISSFAEIGMDVDKLVDWELAKKYLERD